MAREKILVVDDALDMRHLLRSILEQAQFRVTTAANAQEALASLKAETFDLVLLDALLPGRDGFETCREIRQLTASATPRTVPIILLSSRGETYDKVVGLAAGADDYVVKPFAREELISRIQAHLRRVQIYSAEARVSPPRIHIGPLLLDPDAQRACLGPHELTLTTKEFDLLYLLARHVGRVMVREVLLNEVWGGEVYGDSKTLDVHVYRLRKKFDAAAGLGHALETVRGRGYRLKEAVLSAPNPTQS
jgi:DNA-binding response OmpR family regulator